MQLCETSGKEQYPTVGRAWASISRHRLREAKKVLSPYRCPDCDMYHLRSNLKYGRERKRK